MRALVLLLGACVAEPDTKDDTGDGGTTSGSISVTPRSIEFGAHFVGQTADAEITIRNAGTGEVDVTLAIAGPRATDYSLDAYTAAPSAGEVTVHRLHFAPTEWGEPNVSIIIDDAISLGHIEVPVTAQVQIDADGDGHGSTDTGGADCDDANPAVYPGAPDEWYDGIDSDCARNEDYDQDGDGVVRDDDCDDENDAIYPGNVDAWYDGVDSDCAGNDDYDQDGDGFVLEEDCDDEDATVNPGAVDTWYDGIDTDCGGNDDFDQDGDGYASSGWGGDDCDDEDPTVNPGVEETWYDGIDSDCSGDDDYDQDGDGFTVTNDCDDTDPARGEPTTETLDGTDNDCDGTIDDVGVDDIAAGVIYGYERGMSVGDKGRISIDSDVTGDAVPDLVAASPEIDDGLLWVVDGPTAASSVGTFSDLATARAVGESSAYRLAFVATPSGDVDGDGTGDLAFIGESEGGYEYGRAYVFAGGAALAGTLDFDDTIHELTGDSGDDLSKCVGIGDINGDGVNDYALGSSRDNDGWDEDVGNLALFDGTEVDGSVDIGDTTQIHGNDASDYLGSSLAVADVTGDGLADAIVGASGEDGGGSGSGAVYIIAGVADMEWAGDADSAAVAKITGTSGDTIGEDPLPVPGDVDGDGVLDLLIGSEEQGAAWLFLTLPTGTASTTTATHAFTGTGGDFASAIGARSDLDSDGAAEVIIGGDSADVNGSNSGVVWIYSWSSGWAAALTSADASATVAGSSTNAYFGSGLATGGDVDGDGRDDLAVGAVGLDDGASDGGAVYLILGW